MYVTMNPYRLFKKVLLLMAASIVSPGMLFSQEKTPGVQHMHTNQQAEGTALEIRFHKGLEHYHPLMAVWIENMEGEYIHPLYVARSIARGIFGHARYEEGRWQPGEKMIPAALPYWSHKRNIPGPDSLYIPTPENPVPDAYTGATPTGDFVLHTIVADSAGRRFNILFEVNQPWDWNQYWYNSTYPGNTEYLTSAQPAVVYQATVDLNLDKNTYTMEPAGHSHPYGATGELFSDLSTLTSALDIAKKITIKIK